MRKINHFALRISRCALVILFAFCILLTACGNKCEHTYDNACDATCNECEETREVGAHDWSAATCTAPKTCKICGATDGNALGHTPENDDGDCTTAVTCTACDTVIVEAKTAHDHSGEWLSDADGHWHACKSDGCTVIVEKTGHEGGTQTCLGYQCEICNGWYGEKLEHVYQYEDRGSGIVETCANGCDHSGLLRITVPGGDDAVYTGNPIPVKVNALNFNASYTLTYNTHDETAPTNVGHYEFTLTVKDVTITGSYEITAVTPTVTAPTANTLTYTGEAQQLVSAGATNFGTMVYSLTEDGEYTATIPEATNAGNYTVYYYVKGDNNVNDSEKASVTVNIAKATPTYTAPMGLTATYGDTLEDVVLDTATGNTAGAWTWNDGDTTSVGNAGTQIFKATFIPTDSTNYNTVEVELTIAVAKATVTVTANAQSKTCGDVDPKLTYEVSGLMGSDNQNDVLTGDLTREAGENVGVYAITQGSLKANSNYTIAFTGAEFVINQKQIFDDPAEALIYALTYGGTFKLEADLVLDDTFIGVAPGVTVTIDLNGYTITCNVPRTSAILVQNNASLTIIDTSTDKTGSIINSSGAAIGTGCDSYGSGTLIVESGTISGATGVDNDGTFILNGGTVSGTTGVENYDTFIMNGGTVSGAPGVYNSGTFIMNGGTVSLINGGETIHNANGSTYTYNGGTVNGNVVGDNDTSQGEDA